MNKILTLIGLIIVILALFLYLGYYNIAATTPHPGFVDTIFETVKEKSIKRYARDIIKPPLNDEEIMSKGFKHYDTMCVQCHGAPGISERELAKGLYPKPLKFPDKLEEGMGIEQIFWVTRHGIKMSGMPGFGPTHSDEELWIIAGFVDRLRDIPNEKYKQLQDSISGENRKHIHESDANHNPK